MYTDSCKSLHKSVPRFQYVSYAFIGNLANNFMLNYDIKYVASSARNVYVPSNFSVSTFTCQTGHLVARRLRHMSLVIIS